MDLNWQFSMPKFKLSFSPLFSRAPLFLELADLRQHIRDWANGPAGREGISGGNSGLRTLRAFENEVAQMHQRAAAVVLHIVMSMR